MIQQHDLFQGKRLVINTFRSGVSIDVEPLIKKFGGYSFNNGLFRIHTYDTYFKWLGIISDSFPEYAGKFAPFGFDWMGRQFATNLTNPNEIYMFDIAVRECFICDEGLLNFLQNISQAPGDYFSKDCLFQNELLQFNQCISFIVPLALGGKEDESNLGVVDMEVDWGIVGQIHNQM